MLLPFPQKVDNDVSNDVYACADDEKQQPQINHLEKYNKAYWGDEDKD